VTLSVPSATTVTVPYSVTAGTATKGKASQAASFADFAAKSGTLTFKPNVVVKYIGVVVYGDERPEQDETVIVNLGAPSGAVMGDMTGVVTIRDDDGGSTSGTVVSVGDVSIHEGDVTNRNAQFTMTMTRPATATVTVHYHLVAGSATGGWSGTGTPPPGVDFADKKGLEQTAIFKANAAGVTPVQKVIAVKVVADVIPESDETFSIVIDDVSGPATLGDNTGTGTILDDDGTPAPVISATSVGSGFFHSCALLVDRTVKCWGANDYGQLGVGDYRRRGDVPGEMGDNLPPADLGTGRTATSLATGYWNTCALLDDGAAKCWGNNAEGELGQGDTIDLGSGRTATSLSVGGFHVCALLDDGTVKCWGENDNGQLGQGDTAARGNGPGEMGDNLPPIDLGSGRTATAIAAGYLHTCALLDDGTVKCWGSNIVGELGQGDNIARGDAPGQMGDALHPIDLGTGRTATAITASFHDSCALLDDGTVKCWGYNQSGQLGLGDTNTRGWAPGEMGDNLPPVDLGTGRTATAISAGHGHTCALLDNGTVKCWGAGGAQLGLGDTNNSRGDVPGEMGDNLPPVDLGTGRTATVITAGGTHTCAVLDDGTVKCWGENAFGQLGQGDTIARGDAPAQMGDALHPIDLGPA
jgi:alpha-tubulin suppressor-like RCC1 family protein